MSAYRGKGRTARVSQRLSRSRRATQRPLLIIVAITLLAISGIAFIALHTQGGLFPGQKADLATLPPIEGAGGTQPADAADDSLPPEGNKKGHLAPDFRLPTLEGEERSLSDLRGQVVLLNFWATWCGPCRLEMPVIQASYVEHKDEGFVVAAINLGEQAETVAHFVRQYKLDFPILLDRNIAIGQRYGVFSIPMSFFLDRQGVIHEVRIGAMTEDYIEQIIARLLSGT